MILAIMPQLSDNSLKYSSHLLQFSGPTCMIILIDNGSFSYDLAGYGSDQLSQPNSTSTQVGSDKVLIRTTTPPHHQGNF